MTKQNKKIIILFVLIVLNVCFIFGQSIIPPDASNSLSGKFESIFEGILGKLFDFAGDLYYITRKFAHFFEFFALGILSFTNIYLIKKTFKKTFYGFGLFFVLFVAVLDEFIQIFNGRTSSVKDIMIDFLGAATGVAVVFAFNYLKNKILEKKTDAKRK